MDLKFNLKQVRKTITDQTWSKQQKFDRSQYFWKAPMGKSQIKICTLI